MWGTLRVLRHVPWDRLQLGKLSRVKRLLDVLVEVLR